MGSKEEKGVLGGYCDKGDLDDLAVCDMGNLGDMAYLDC